MLDVLYCPKCLMRGTADTEIVNSPETKVEYLFFIPSEDWMSQQFLNINNKSSLHINSFSMARQAVHVECVRSSACKTESRLFYAFSMVGFQY